MNVLPLLGSLAPGLSLHSRMLEMTKERELLE